MSLIWAAFNSYIDFIIDGAERQVHINQQKYVPVALNVTLFF